MKLLSCLMLCALTTFSVLAAETGLYIQGGERFEILQTKYVLDKVIQESGKENILIFVHGRGRHPEKGIKIIDEIEERFNAKVIMFHWDSWINTWTRPVESAENAAHQLYYFLTELNSYKKENMFTMANINLSLMAHSMGTITYGQMLKTYGSTGLDKNLFRNVILNEGDIAVRDHAEWLDKSDFQENLYVTYNKFDLILYLSTKIDSGKRLGQGIETFTGKIMPWSNRAIYIDLTSVVGLNHKTYMLKDRDHYFPALNFYQKLFEGHDFDLNDYENKIYPKRGPASESGGPMLYELRH